MFYTINDEYTINLDHISYIKKSEHAYKPIYTRMIQMADSNNVVWMTEEEWKELKIHLPI